MNTFRQVFRFDKALFLSNSIKNTLIDNPLKVQYHYIHISVVNKRLSRTTSTSMEGVRLSWNGISVDQIKTSADELIAKSKAVYDEVGGVPGDKASFDTVIKVMLNSGNVKSATKK